MNEAQLAVKPNQQVGRLSRVASLDLDLVRGLAAIAVVLSHWRALFYKDFDQFAHPGLLAKLFYTVTGLGHQAVMVFFVLSGFLVGGNVMRAFRTNRWSWRRYANDRLTRLYAVLVPALVLGLVWDASGIWLNGTQGIYGGNPEFKYMVAYRVADRLSPGAFVGSLAFLQTIVVPPFGSNGVLWSLANEFWYYVAFPLLWIALATSARPVMRVLALVGTVAILAGTGREIATLFLVWLMGAALAYGTLPKALGKSSVRYGAFAVWLVVLLLHRAQRLGSSVEFSDLVLGGATCVWLASLVAQSEGSRSAFRTKASESLSKISYTCYLFHLPFLIWFVSFIRIPRWDFNLANAGNGLLVLLPVALYVIAGWWAFERNTPRLRTWLKDRFLDRSPHLIDNSAS